MAKDETVSAGQSSLAQIRAVVSRFEEGDDRIATVSDVADEIERIISESSGSAVNDMIREAIAGFRKEQAYDYELAGRGDMDRAEEQFMGVVERCLSDSENAVSISEPLAQEATYYHGTSAKRSDSFSGDVAYFTKEPAEAETFAENPILGGGRGADSPRIIEAVLPKGKTMDIDGSVDDAIMEGGDLDELISKQAEAARSEGYDYLSFSHPSSVRERGDFQVIVAVYPSKIRIISQRDI